MTALTIHVYMRVSTEGQDIERQEALLKNAEAMADKVAIYPYYEKASGARADRPELNRMINALGAGHIVMAEKMDRISRLPLPEAEALIKTIKDKGARLAIPNVVDLSELINSSKGTAKVVLESVQAMLLKLALQMAREDYEDRRERQRQGIAIAQQKDAKQTNPERKKYKGRAANTKNHKRIIDYRTNGKSIAETAELCECSTALVKRVWKKHNESK